jgi:hypothetical protein
MPGRPKSTTKLKPSSNISRAAVASKLNCKACYSNLAAKNQPSIRLDLKTPPADATANQKTKARLSPICLAPEMTPCPKTRNSHS